jgi:hypothetical protein
VGLGLGLGLGALVAVTVASVDRAGGAPAQAAPTPRDQYNAAQAAVAAAQARVDELFGARRGLEAEGGRLSTEQRAIADRLEAARADAQQFVIAAYIAGSGQAGVESAIIQQESTTDVAYKSFFVKDRAQRVQGAVDEQRSAFTEVDQRIADFATRRGDNASALDTANADLDRALATLREADARLRQAQAAETAALRALAPPAPPASSGGGGSGNASSSGWAALRKCESGGRYNAVDPSGTYRGAYQFDRRTWAGLGGSGDPAAASQAEQDYRAQLLYNQRGAQPWPICGKNLLNDPNARHEAIPP